MVWAKDYIKRNYSQTKQPSLAATRKVRWTPWVKQMRTFFRSELPLNTQTDTTGSENELPPLKSQIDETNLNFHQSDSNLPGDLDVTSWKQIIPTLKPSLR